MCDQNVKCSYEHHNRAWAFPVYANYLREDASGNDMPGKKSIKKNQPFHVHKCIVLHTHSISARKKDKKKWYNNKGVIVDPYHHHKDAEHHCMRMLMMLISGCVWGHYRDINSTDGHIWPAYMNQNARRKGNPARTREKYCVSYLHPGGEREWKVERENISALSAIFLVTQKQRLQMQMSAAHPQTLEKRILNMISLYSLSFSATLAADARLESNHQNGPIADPKKRESDIKNTHVLISIILCFSRTPADEPVRCLAWCARIWWWWCWWGRGRQRRVHGSDRNRTSG